MRDRGREGEREWGKEGGREMQDEDRVREEGREGAIAEGNKIM